MSRLRLYGHFFRPLSSAREAGEIEVFNGAASITMDDETVCSGAGIQSVQGKKDIYLDNGHLFTLAVPLTAEQEKLLMGKGNRGIAWLENFSLSKALILALALIAVLAAFRYTLVQITPSIVAVFPAEWERAIGRNTYESFENTFFDRTQLSPLQVTRLHAKAAQLASANGFESPEIFFHQAKVMGPNAIAFPGGPIVVTDDLVELLEEDDLILGVIAHELAHVRQRHALHHLVEAVGVIAIASVLLGSDDILIEEMSFVFINLWASNKSRAFEKEADLLAVEYLERADLDRAAFGSVIEKLTRHFCSLKKDQSMESCLEETESGWLSSHPSGAERLEYLSDP